MARDLLRRFSWMSAGVWVGLALVLGTGVTYLVERKMLERATLVSLDYFKNLARFITTKEEFVRLRTGAEYEAFDRLIKEDFFTSHVVTVKIYDWSGITIYHSRNREVVGRSFPGNVPLQKALRGETVVGLSDLRGTEHLTERQAGYSRLFEVYIPIFLEGTNMVIGAYEIYSLIDPFYQRVWSLRLPVWGAIFFGLALLYVALSLTFRRASSTILEQHAALARQAEELRQAYEQLKQTQSQLVQSEKLASAGRLAAGVVHEVGNPLASILGMVDLLLRCGGRPGDARECRENLSRMASEIGRLKWLLRGLIDYARPGQVEIRPVNLNAVVELTLLLIRAQRDMKGIEVIQRLQDPSPWALADDRLLQQLLVNIVLNAAQAMPQGGRLTVATREDSGEVGVDGAVTVGRPVPRGVRAALVSVADTGYGIPPAHLDRIFEPFFSTKTPGTGTGLGLAICHSIIQELGGSIVVSSRPGEGTVFHILLPVAVGMEAGAVS